MTGVARLVSDFRTKSICSSDSDVIRHPDEVEHFGEDRLLR
jgi:hypothetical protein